MKFIDIFKGIEITTLEIIGVSIYAVLMIMTLNYQISIVITLLTLAVVISFKDNFFKKLSRLNTWLLFLLGFLFLTDGITTIIAVHFMKIAIETNQFIILIWNLFGIAGGQIVYTGYLSLLLFIFYIAKKSKNKILTLILFLILTTLVVTWTFAEISNITILFNHLC